MLDADEDYLPAAEARKLRRYLYIVNVPDDFEYGRLGPVACVDGS